MLPNGLAAEIELSSWPVLPIFQLLQNLGNIELSEMLRTFNMGVGMVVAVPQRKCESAVRVLQSLRERAYLIGRVVRGRNEVVYR
jgi:phosphoribosylformylglycinamidine cyclo-ligase